MGRASREKRERRAAAWRRTLAALAAGGKLDMITRVERGREVVYLHIPPEYRRSPDDTIRYLLSCLPGQSVGDD